MTLRFVPVYAPSLGAPEDRLDALCLVFVHADSARSQLPVQRTHRESVELRGCGEGREPNRVVVVERLS